VSPEGFNSWPNDDDDDGGGGDDDDLGHFENSVASLVVYYYECCVFDRTIAKVQKIYKYQGKVIPLQSRCGPEGG